MAPIKVNFTSFQNTINGELTTTPKTRHGVNPATGEALPEVPICRQEDVDAAVAAARVAFKSWSKTTWDERRAALYAFSDALDAQKDDFADMLTREQGKPLDQSYQEIGMAVMWLKKLTHLELPETVIEDNEERKIVRRHVPLGVACGIVPWNYPILLACGKIAPAIYAGNAMIIKPSPFTPYCDLKMGELAQQFFPPGVFSVLSGDDDLGPMLTDHDGIDKISFTGSSLTGKKVMASCARTLKRVTLELGGNDAAIVCEDVDIEKIIPQIAVLCFLCSAQICMMIKRLYVHETIYDKFRDALVKAVSALKSGEGHEPGVFFGPLQNSMQFEKVKELMNDVVVNEGVTTALGGKLNTTTSGYFITPTIIDNPPECSRIVTEEPFGPIVPILKWSDEADVIRRANDTKMGLGGSVWTKDLVRGDRIARQLEAGSVWVNNHFQVAPHVPFGGHKWSGLGMEWGVTGLEIYCNPQSVWIFK